MINWSHCDNNKILLTSTCNLLAGIHAMQQQCIYLQAQHLRILQAMSNLLPTHVCSLHPALLSAKTKHSNATRLLEIIRVCMTSKNAIRFKCSELYEKHLNKYYSMKQSTSDKPELVQHTISCRIPIVSKNPQDSQFFHLFLDIQYFCSKHL